SSGLLPGVSDLRQQGVIKCPARLGQSHATLLYLTKTCGMRPYPGLTGKLNLLLQGFETGLAQQNGMAPARWAFNQFFGRDPPLGHGLLYRINIQGSGSQVIDMGALETNNIGHQTMCLM